jgi:hypothetical protein
MAMRFRMMLGRRLGMMDGVQLVPVRDMRVVAGTDMIARFMVFRRFAVVMRRVIQMFGGLVVVMVRRVFFAHCFLLGSR